MSRWRSPARAHRRLLLAVGLLLPQLWLTAPALFQGRLMIPLDLLALPGVYLPPAAGNPVPYDHTLSDQVLSFEPRRRFVVEEVRSGRLPFWCPHWYAGAPVLYDAMYSPFRLPRYLLDSPRALPLREFLRALLLGIGGYLFFRRVLRAGPWPALVGAWALPLGGYFVLWQGYPKVYVAAYFPLLLLLVERTVRKPLSGSAGGVALVTALCILGASLNAAGQALLASGLCGLVWALRAAWRRRSARRLAGTLMLLGCAWGAGFAIASPWLLPLVRYQARGTRIQVRRAGGEERPPVGLKALPAVLFPDIYGRDARGSVRLAPDIQLESSSTAYAGCLLALCLAPCAFARRRWLATGFAALALLGVAWVADLPPVVQLLRLPGLRLLSYSRFTFLTGFSIVALAVLGLDNLRAGYVLRRRWLPVLLLLLAGVAAGLLSSTLPPLAEQEASARLAAGWPVRGLESPAAIARLVDSVRWTALTGLGWCLLAVGFWTLLRRRWAVPLFVVLSFVELALFLPGRQPPQPAEWYYPPLPVLERVREAGGRALGVGCLPANLLLLHGIDDPRGYDGFDPADYVRLLDLCADPASRSPGYARTQGFRPRLREVDGRLDVLPFVDLLGVRSLLFRQRPADTTAVALGGYWLVTNPEALPRAFVPTRVALEADRARREERLASWEFEPSRLALVEQPLALPDSCVGTARVVEELPAELVLEAELATDGLVVLADRWEVGWSAEVDGVEVPVLRVDGVLRGVALPAGSHRIVMRYWPDGLTPGLWALLVGGLLVLGWELLRWRLRPPPAPAPPAPARPAADGGG